MVQRPSHITGYSDNENEDPVMRVPGTMTLRLREPGMRVQGATALGMKRAVIRVKGTRLQAQRHGAGANQGEAQALHKAQRPRGARPQAPTSHHPCHHRPHGDGGDGQVRHALSGTQCAARPRRKPATCGESRYGVKFIRARRE